MRWKIRFSLAIIFAAIACPAFSEEPIFLTDEDVSRGRLGQIDALIVEPESKGIGLPFLFPEDLNSGYVYGIDISHHSLNNGVVFDWQKLPELGIYYVYVKATQGTRFVDKTFDSTWKSLGSLDAPRRGAYHFLTSAGEADAQAANFLAAIVSAGEFQAGKDMPPVVDLEWDCKVEKGKVALDKSGRCIDQWVGTKPAEISAKVERFSKIIEEALGVRPVIYTAASWWNEIGLTTEISGYTLWIADYTKSAQRVGKPRTPQGQQFTIWQFTDNSKVHAKCEPTHAAKRDQCNDANVFLGDKKQFDEAFGLMP
jgi:lysozyme